MRRIEEQKTNALVKILGVPLIEHVAFSEEKDEEEEVTLMAWNTALSNDETMWEEACRFFRHDPSYTEQGVKLPGLSVTTRNYQMVDSYKMLRACYSSEYNGTFNCSKPGLGKTLEVLVAASAIVLAYMSKEAFQKNPEAHFSEEDGHCPLRHPFGIECYCIRNSLTRQICKTIHRAPQFVVAPAGIVKQWCKEWAKTLESVVTLPNGTQIPGPLIHLAWVENSKIRTSEGCQKLHMPDFMAFVELDGMLPSHTKMKNIALARKQKKYPTDPNITVTDDEIYTTSLSTIGNISKELCCLPLTAPFTLGGIARERLMLICSSTVVSQGSLNSIFTAGIEVQQLGRKSERSMTLHKCFQPSAIYYDEWTEGKGKGTNIVKTLKDLCMASISPRDTHKSPFVCLLSGTPMPRGPKCLEGVMPLITDSQEMERQVRDLVTAYQKANLGMGAGRSADSGDEEGGALLRDWQEKAEKALNGCMFQRRYGMPFLDGRIPDPRPQIARYRPYFADITAEHREQLEELRKSLKERISQIDAKSVEKKLAMVSKTSEFQTAHRCAVLPGIPSLGERLMDWLFHRSTSNDSNDSIMLEYLRENIEKAGCRQLTLLEEIVIQQARQGDHGIVLTVAPSNVTVAAEWLSKRLGADYRIIEVSANNPKPSQRAAFVSEVEAWIGQNTDKRVILVSTYKLLSTGLDGLQRFANFLVKLREPWTTKETEQAEGRIHRSGQKKLSVVYSIHGAEGSIDWELVQKNSRNMHLLGVSQGILGHFMRPKKSEAKVEDRDEIEGDL